MPSSSSSSRTPWNAPDQSLAVIALNVRHAERLRQRITQAVNGQPALADFFSEDRVEPFVVVDVAGARGLSRDRVVVSVGYAKNTPRTCPPRLRRDFHGARRRPSLRRAASRAR